MAYLKSLGAGVLAVVAALIVCVIVIFAIYNPYGTNAIAFTSVLRSAKLWLIVAISFAAGFAWEFRRVAQ